VGGARTALFAWLKARQEGGDFVVRVEDTDTARSTRESEESVLADLNWLGLKWDEGPAVGGDKGPYRQSERMESGMYQELAQKLIASGDAYPCFCTAEELEAKRLEAEAKGENPQYDGMWRDADPEEVQKRMDAGEAYTVRFKVPKGKVVTIQDSVRGEVSWDVEATVGDFILLRSGGMPVYNFCVAVDDALMKVSDVIRAEEHLTNTVRQVLILEALGYDWPKYAHLSLVLGEDRSKLSKRHGATSVNQFKLEGFLPAAMINYLCLLGWNDGTDKEIYTVDELIDAFSLSRVTKSPAVFDMKKLRWINGQHLRALPADELEVLIGAHLLEAGVLSQESPAFTKQAAQMVAEKVELVNDASPLITDALAYPIEETLQSDAASAFVADGVAEVGQAVLEAYRAGELPDPASDDFGAAWKAWVKGAGKALGRKGKGLFMPLRIVMTGRMSGPDIPAQLALLGLASEEVTLQVASLAARMDALEKALSALPQPAPA
jgi:glutamyl-tRNA synthetase